LNSKIAISISISLIAILEFAMSSITLADSHRNDSHRNYCYDQVGDGDGHFCFDTKKECKHEQKHDDIAETPCYNKNRQ